MHLDNDANPASLSWGETTTIGDREHYANRVLYNDAIRRANRLEIAAHILGHSVTAHGWAMDGDECRRRAKWALEMADALVDEAGKP